MKYNKKNVFSHNYHFDHLDGSLHLHTGHTDFQKKAAFHKMVENIVAAVDNLVGHKNLVVGMRVVVVVVVGMVERVAVVGVGKMVVVIFGVADMIVVVVGERMVLADGVGQVFVLVLELAFGQLV